MFKKVLQKFKEKFGETKRDSSRETNENENKIIISLEEKSTFDIEDFNEISLISLLSMKDKEGNTPILFAAFRGNLEIIKELINLGVSYECRNKAGLNIIHMAAQSDHPDVIVYFKEKYEMNLFEEDNQGNNAIHWACSNSSKITLDYLLSYINEKEDNLNVINHVNNNGQTALHITILTTASISSIKKLIKKGIDFKIKDNNDLNVFELVKGNKKYENVEKVLKEYTERNAFGLNFHINDKLNIYYKFIIFLILLTIVEFILFFDFIPYLNYESESLSWTTIIYYSSSIIFFLSYIYIIFSDPGIIKPRKASWLEILAKEPEIKKKCPYCKIDLTKYSKHCFICNKCITYYDHHCHWINNCVGHRNRVFFLVFIILLLGKFVANCFLSTEVLVIDLENYNNEDNIMNNIYFRKIMAFIILSINAFFFFPVSYLFYRQIANKSQLLSQQKEVQNYYKELKEIDEEGKQLEIKKQN